MPLFFNQISSLKKALELYYLDHEEYPDIGATGGDWRRICTTTPDSFKSQLNGYVSGIFNVEDCDAILYYSRPVNPYYLNVCGTPQFTTNNGYIIAYKTSLDTKDNYFFYTEPGKGNWSCRSHNQ